MSKQNTSPIEDLAGEGDFFTGEGDFLMGEGDFLRGEGDFLIGDFLMGEGLFFMEGDTLRERDLFILAVEEDVEGDDCDDGCRRWSDPWATVDVFFVGIFDFLDEI